ncbi:MAG TPA: hypothetical protein VE571_08950 [Solirubrobacteraceae bacterium]|nr:hypothetical protein [Solirubrobacteraceae bacterium]
MTGAQRATIERQLAQHGPRAAFTAERDEPHGRHVFVAIYRADGTLAVDTAVEADGSLPDNQG